MNTTTLSRRPLRRFWGWGLADERLGGDERRLVLRRLGPDADAARPAPYFTSVAATGATGSPAGAWARWREIKPACNAAVVRHGGTSTHHHAVGRDHRSACEAEVPALLRAALAAAKAQFDPQGLMNPGVLLEPQGRPAGIRGGTVG